jgi:phosphoribosylanthranilate isomerase
LIVQVYGVTTPEDARVVADAGADYVGVVLEEGFGTWDAVDEATARAIVRELTDVTTVALSLATDEGDIRRTVETLRPQIAHVVRITETWQPDAVALLRERLAPVALMLTVAVRDATAIDVARQFESTCDYLLLDTAHPTTDIVGATGATHDWRISRGIVDAVTTPVILAGGLGPENVVQAIAQVQPAGVDSETRTSRDDDRRRKDARKVQQFVDLARGERSRA